jgi:hypothetical protein
MKNYVIKDVNFDSYLFYYYLSMNVNILLLFQYLVFINDLVLDFIV